MIFLLLAWVVFGGCSFLIGNTLLTLLKPANSFVRHFDRFFVSVWLGIAIIAPIILAISVLTPLKPILATAVFVGAVGLSVIHRESRNCAWDSLSSVTATAGVGTIITALGVAAYSSQIITWYDSGLYHEQAIKWLAEFGSVPGLALIHERLGFSSSWFALIAPLNHGILQGRIYSMTGGFVFFMMLLGLTVNLLRIANKRGEVEDVFLVVALLIAIPVILFWRMAVSPSPDLPVIVLTIVIAWVILKISRQTIENVYSIDETLNILLLPFILSLSAVTMKLSAFPLVIVTGCFYLFGGKFFIRKSAIAACTGVFFLAPFMAVNAMTSGYLLFPSSLLRIQFPWTMKIEAVKNTEKIIQEWARWGSKPTPSWGNDFNWIIPWLNTEKICAMLVLLSLVSISIIIFSAKRFQLNRNKYVIAIALVGIAFMMYKAPTLRFGLAYLVILPSLVLAYYINKSISPPDHSGITGICINHTTCGIAITSLLLLHIFFIPLPHYRLVIKSIKERQIKTDDNPYINWLVPPLPISMFFKMADNEQKTISCESLRYITANIDGLFYYRPEEDEDQCWDHSLPCVPKEIKNVRLRKPYTGLAGGFMAAGDI